MKTKVETGLAIHSSNMVALRDYQCESKERWNSDISSVVDLVKSTSSDESS